MLPWWVLLVAVAIVILALLLISVLDLAFKHYCVVIEDAEDWN